MFNKIEEALASFKKGNPIVVVDDESRENEGDVIFPADMATQEKLNFCAVEARGLVCIAIDKSTANRLDLRPMNSNHKDNFHTAFYDSVDATHQWGISTGISAKERAITAKHIASKQSQASDFIKPGHLFPIVAKDNGVLIRSGHTEAAVDLCLLTGHEPAAIICEIMNLDGDMMRREGLSDFAKKHALSIITIQQIIDYRIDIENHIEHVSTAALPTQFGNFIIKAFRNKLTNLEHVVVLNETNVAKKPFVRIHSECLTGDIFGSQRCDCQNQIHTALSKIAEIGHGYVIYLKGQEGRGIGIANKIAAYHLQETGIDTYQANADLGLSEDNRQYQDAVWILKNLGIDNFDFMTNNPKKIESLQSAKFTFEVIAMPASPTTHNLKYLQDKISIAHHTIKMPL